MKHLTPATLIYALLAVLATPVSAHAEAPESTCKMEYVYTLPLSFTSHYLQPTIPGSINGHPIKVLFDTGAVQTLVMDAELNKLKIPLRQTDSNSYGVGGSAAMFQARLSSLTIGPASAKGWFDVLETPRNGMPFGAIAGAKSLLQMDLEIHLAEKYVRFLKPQGCGNTSLAYWDTKAPSLPLTPYSEHDYRPQFMVKINGQSVLALLDTGASATVLDAAVAKKIGISPQSSGAIPAGFVKGIGNKLQKIWSVPVDSLDIGDEQVKNIRLNIAEGGNEFLVLGADFLRSHRVLISMDQRRIYFSYLGGEIFSQKDTQGEPWFLGEAEAGNADAQFSMARLNDGDPAHDRTKALAWLKKAAAQGHPQAQADLAQYTFISGDFAVSAVHWNALLEHDASNGYAAVWRYLSAARAGQQVKAFKDLQASKPGLKMDPWLGAVVAFHLGQIDEAGLLKASRSEADAAASRLCQVNYQMANAHLAAGKSHLARPLLETVLKDCSKRYWEYKGAVSELARLPGA